MRTTVVFLATVAVTCYAQVPVLINEVLPVNTPTVADTKTGKGKIGTKSEQDGKQDAPGLGKSERIETKPPANPPIAGLEDARQAAVLAAIAQAGIVLTPDFTHAELLAAKKQATTAGVDLEAAVTAAVTAFLDQGVTDGTITPEAAAAFLANVNDAKPEKGNKIGNKPEKQGNQKKGDASRFGKSEDVSGLNAAVAAALKDAGITRKETHTKPTAPIAGLEEARQAAVLAAIAEAGIVLTPDFTDFEFQEAKKQTTTAGVDLEAVVTAAVTSFFDQGVTDGTITPEAAAAFLAHVNDEKVGKGSKPFATKPSKPDKKVAKPASTPSTNGNSDKPSKPTTHAKAPNVSTFASRLSKISVG